MANTMALVALMQWIPAQAIWSRATAPLTVIPGLLVLGEVELRRTERHLTATLVLMDGVKHLIPLTSSLLSEGSFLQPALYNMRF